MVDFHYSDHFTDPKYQDTPAQWQSHNYEQLKEDIYNHTYTVLEKMAASGIRPEWVQVGNEINSGILFPHGCVKTNFEQLSGFLNSGYDAVKAIDSGIKVVTHLAEGHSNEIFRWFFNNFLGKYDGKTDVIGLSYYPYWLDADYTKNIQGLEENLLDMTIRYDKEVIVSEVGGDEADEDNTYSYLDSVIRAVKNVPRGKGLGVFYWEPEGNSSALPDQYPLCATKRIDDTIMQFTRAMDAFLEG